MRLRLHSADLITKIVFELHARSLNQIAPRAVVDFVASEDVRVELTYDVYDAVDEIQFIFVVLDFD
jgi:5,10-methenyltetrahydromethanopterin hydrogenase